MQIIYFGKPYSFAHIAAIRRFGNKNSYISRDTIDQVVESLKQKSGSLAVVPIENTTGGIILDTVDILSSEENLDNLSIAEELELNIELFLIGKKKIPLEQIKKVYSHEYPLKRSENWIKRNLSSGVKLVKTTSTSEAVNKIKNIYECAIASKDAAKYYKYSSLAEIIYDPNEKKNITRFFILKNENNS
jgi:chorismate mutase / prephenate dehydratase